MKFGVWTFGYQILVDKMSVLFNLIKCGYLSFIVIFTSPMHFQESIHKFWKRGKKTDEICETFLFFIIIYLSKIECKLKCKWNEEAVVVLTCYIKLHNYTLEQEVD